MVRANADIRNDAELALACAGGDDRAFDLLMTRHRDMIYTLCCRMMPNSDDADDCAQESFVKAYSKIKTYRGEAGFGTWLSRIAYHTCLDHLRSAKKMKKTSIDCDADDPGFEIADTRSEPSAALDRSEKQRLIADALAELDPAFRAVVVLCDIEGRSYEDIAEITGIPAGTVKSRIARGRDKLRAQLKGIL